MITVVSGLPRSGTSMMMQMLEAGGIEPFVDNIRRADEDNPRGYFELEKVKRLKTDNSWLGDAEEKVVKVISQLLFDLPLDKRYKVVFMRRHMPEILASQRAMIERRGTKGASVSSEALGNIYTKHLTQITKWLSENDAFEVLYVDYREIIDEVTIQVDRICNFFDYDLDKQAMITVVDPDLYRQKQSTQFNH